MRFSGNTKNDFENALRVCHLKSLILSKSIKFFLH